MLNCIEIQDTKLVFSHIALSWSHSELILTLCKIRPLMTFYFGESAIKAL